MSALQASSEAGVAMAKIIFEKNIEIPMHDGCVLRGDLFRLDTSEKLPVIINRTPYNKAMPMVFALTMDALRAASAGYNVLIQDCRGRFASDGVFNCFTDEARDGYDTVEWAARQPWSNGNIGMYGASYMGATQWLAATQAPPHLKCISPLITASDYHDGWTYQGGAFSLFFNVSWAMGALAPARLLRERVTSSITPSSFTGIYAPGRFWLTVPPYPDRPLAFATDPDKMPFVTLRSERE
jgi:putative CocE/NonD family hydrolase